MGNNHYECLGHSDRGDKHVPAYHGDPSRNWQFWVYPLHLDIVNPKWDMRVNLCNHHEIVGK